MVKSIEARVREYKDTILEESFDLAPNCKPKVIKEMLVKAREAGKVRLQD